MPTTTVYGHWTNIIDPTSSTVEQTVAKFLVAAAPDWAAALEESGVLEDIVQEFRDAINDALPTGVTLAGSEFVGPADCDPAEWAGYPVTGDELDIAEIVESVDLGAIVERYAPHRREEDSAPMVCHAEVNTIDLDGRGTVKLEIGELEVWNYASDGSPLYEYTGKTIESVTLNVTADSDNEVIEEAAEAALEKLGYTLADGEDWQYSDVSLYARVVRDQQ